MKSEIFNLVFIFLIMVTTDAFGSKSSVLDGKLVGGVSVRPREMTFMVSMRLRSYPLQHFCGGCIISFYHVLTAAHCVHPSLIRKMGVNDIGLGVVAGSIDIPDGGTWYDVKNVVIDGSFLPRKSPSPGDIAVVTLKDRVILTESISIIELSTTPVPVGSLGLVAGWGCVHILKRKQNVTLSDTLKIILVRIEDKIHCKKDLRHIKIYKSHLCVLPIDGRELASKGDSGGPIIVNGTVVGVTSYGECKLTGFPFLCNKVTKFMEVIEETLRLEIKRELKERHNPQPMRSTDPRSPTSPERKSSRRVKRKIF